MGHLHEVHEVISKTYFHLMCVERPHVSESVLFVNFGSRSFSFRVADGILRARRVALTLLPNV